MYSNNAVVTNGTTFTLMGTEGERPKEAPKGLIATQAVQTSKGHLAQVYVDKEIVWEDGPFENGKSAIDAANAQVVDKIKKLFTG